MRGLILLNGRAIVWWVVVHVVISKAICATSQDGSTVSTKDPWLESENLHERDLIGARIVGGVQASQREFPFFVEWSGCGGTLIDKNLVLTAAHCNVLPASYNGVWVGAYADQSSLGGAQYRTITARHAHPQFDNVTMDYDYMVLVLDTPVSGITPVKLNADPNYPVNNQVLTVIGFGSTYYGGNLVSVLRKVNVNYVNPLTCNTDYGWQIIAVRMLCAGVPSGGKDSCQGDSGGPILDEHNVQVGIVSFGNGCAVAGYPGVYSRISGGLSWINQQVCKYSSNPPSSCKSPQAGSPRTPLVSSLRAPTRKPTTRPVASLSSSSTCNDSSNAIVINGKQKSCDWLSVRPSLWSSQCVTGKLAYTYCKKTCKRC